MTSREQYRYRLVDEMLKGKMRRREVAQLLGVRERTVSRLAARIRRNGLEGAVHGNRGRSPANKLARAPMRQAAQLVRERYYDFNMQHALEMLRQHHAIELSYSSFRRLCHREKLARLHPRRRPKIHRRRERMSAEGMLLQFDGSHHEWVKGQGKWCLIAAIDDATSEVTAAQFFTTEATLTCMTVMRDLIATKGVPLAFYVDRAGWFGGMKRQNTSQIQRALEELGTRLIFAYTPQAKGRIERFWRTVQDRLIPEMRLKKITNLEAANQYLAREFLPRYWNKHHRLKPVEATSRYRRAPSPATLREIFCIKEHRTVRGDQTLFWERQSYRVEADCALKGREIELRTYLDGTWRAFFKGRPVAIQRYGIQRPNPDAIKVHWKPKLITKVTNSLAI